MGETTDDLAEARALISEFAARQNTGMTAPIIAAMKAVFDDLAKLAADKRGAAWITLRPCPTNKTHAWDVIFETRTGCIHFDHERSAWSVGVHVLDSGGYHPMSRATGGHDVPLVLNAWEQRYEGADDDSVLVPVPGKPRRKRAAVAVLLADLLALMAGHSNAKATAADRMAAEAADLEASH